MSIAKRKVTGPLSAAVFGDTGRVKTASLRRCEEQTERPDYFRARRLTLRLSLGSDTSLI